MINYIKKIFAVDDIGAKNLITACFASLFTTFAILFTNISLFLFLQDVITPILKENQVSVDHIKYIMLSIGLMLILIVFVLLKYVKAYIPVYFEAAKKRIKMAERLRKLPISYFGKKDIADITTTIMKDAASLEDVFSAYIPSLFSAIISTVILSIGIFIYDATLGLAIFWSVPISFTLVFLTKNIQTKESAKTKKIVLGYLDKLQEVIENIKDIKSNNREIYHQDDINTSFEALEKSLTVSEFKVGSMVTSIQMILKIGMASTVLVSTNMLLNNQLTTFEFLIFLMIATRIYDPLLSAMINLSALFHASLSIKRTKEFENTKIQEGKENPNYQGYDIEFSEVDFSYEDGYKVLNKLTFHARQGEVTALVGPSGGGKSTVLRLASRFYDFDQGKITLGKENISKIDPEKLLESISIVFQDVILFDNTIMENIRLGKKGASDEAVIAAAKNAQCHEFIMQMKDGYQTMIGENGSKISGGERQRISIARALLKDAPVVFLDEATSSLDIKNETAVQKAISNLTKDKTVIVIAHRMRTIMGANKIIVLKDGQVSQSGTHEQLIEIDGDYKTMVNLQMEASNWKL